MSRNYRVIVVAPVEDWLPLSPQDVPAKFSVVGGEPERCALNNGILLAERFNVRAIADRSFVHGWAVLIRDRHRDGKGGA